MQLISRSTDLWKIILSQEESPFLIHSGGKSNMIVFPLPFHISVPLGNLWLLRLQGQFPILRIRIFPDLCPLIHPPRRRPLALGGGRTNPGIHSVPSYDSRRCMVGVFRSLGMRPEGISHMYVWSFYRVA